MNLTTEEGRLVVASLDSEVKPDRVMFKQVNIDNISTR